MANETNKFTVGQIIFMIISIFLFPAFILFLAGDWFWIEGWIFSIWFLVMTLSIGMYLQLHDPALLAERQKVHSDDQKGWDKYYIWVAYISLVAWIVIMPLDAKRYGWTTVYFPLWLKVLGGIALLPSLFFEYRSVVENTFASTLVRIQSERKQYVISSGVYGFVRHPLYLGNTFMLIGAPLMLGSIYGLIIGLISVFLMAGRIIGEEQMLVNELEGYKDYRNKVKYRLIPFVW